jgi:predicted transcriptional regulator
VAKAENQDVILLSIFPQFAQAILRGEKKVEFRKPTIRATVTHVVIYATSPQMRVVGFFEVKEVHRHSPRKLWERFGRVGSITRRDFFRYYDGHNEAICFEVGHVWILEQPLPLEAIHRRLSPPQGFRYLPLAAWEKVRTRGRLSVTA